MFKVIAAAFFLTLAQVYALPVFVGTGADGIYLTDLDPSTGKLSEATLVAEQPWSGFLALRPDRKVLFSTAQLEEEQGGVAAWSIEGTKLTLINRATYPGKGLCQIVLDATDRVLIGADYGGGSVVSFSVDESGSLGKHVSFFKHQITEKKPAPQNQSHAHAMWPGPDNRFAYAPDLGIDRVKIYALDPKTAKLTPAGEAKSPAGAGPRHMKFSRDGKHAYVLNELHLTVTVFARNATTGALTEVQTVSVLPEGANRQRMSCSEIVVSADGKYVYTGNRDAVEKKRDSISVLAVQEDATLKLIQTISSKVWIVRNINLSPKGDFLLAAGQRSNEVTSFKVDQKTGRLTFTGHRTVVPTAMCLVFP